MNTFTFAPGSALLYLQVHPIMQLVRMGKTNPTYRELLDEWIDGWRYFRRGLRNHWTDAFADLMDGAKQHADAASHSNPAGPLEINVHALVSICLAQQLQIRELEDRLEELEE